MSSAIGSITALVAGLAVLLSARGGLGQTTLVGAWRWTLAALIAWAGVELWAVFSQGGGALPAIRFAAIAVSFCPAIAVVGAKRPQHRAWNFVVLSLWIIVAMPAVEAIFLQRGQGVKVGDLRGWFLWVLIGLGTLNFVPTRYWLAALVFFAGQIVALSPQLALIRRPLVQQPELIGLMLSAGALIAAWVISLRETAATGGHDRAWLDFRDTFGLFWALRVQERINAAARQYDWDIELTWSGFCRRGSGARLTEIDPAIEAALRTTLRGLLRRFVSSEWIGLRWR